MKVVNPVGRSMGAFENQADYHRCVCSTWAQQQIAYNGHVEDDSFCGCQCSYGPENSLANASLSGI